MDIVTEYLSLILERQSVPTKFRKRVEVYILKDDKLVVGYKKKIDTYLSAGGGVEKGQSLEVAAKMECLEELGIAISNPILITKQTFKTDWYKLQAQGVELTDKIQRRMKVYRGQEIHFMKADFDKINKSLYNRANDAMKPMVMTKQALIAQFKKQPWDINKFRIKMVRSL